MFSFLPTDKSIQAAALDTPKYDFYNRSMITITKEFEFTSTYDLNRLGNPEDLLFFDIETTGLSARKDMVYLIGCVYTRNGIWYMKQWFADSADAEKELLVHFYMFSSKFSTLVHFNGTTFDIPFLKERADRSGTLTGKHSHKSLDIYKQIRPFKKLLGLPDCKQKTLEAFLGTNRQDKFNGGQLIDIYWEYLRTKKGSLYEALLLHNEEDIEGLPALLQLLSYQDFFQGNFLLESERIHHYQTSHGEKARELIVSCKSETSVLPVPVSFSSGSCSFFCRESSLTFRLPVFDGTLKYFFKDYVNYYYLPDEDRAIHKSIAAYVDKGHRKKATAKTCYQKRQSSFIPFPSEAAGEHPQFYEEYKKQPSYIEYQENLWESPEILQKFLLATLPK